MALTIRTKVALADAVGQEPRHLVDVCFLTRLSATTIYKAHKLGYLDQEGPGIFWASDKLMEEVSFDDVRVVDLLQEGNS